MSETVSVAKQSWNESAGLVAQRDLDAATPEALLESVWTLRDRRAAPRPIPGKLASEVFNRAIWDMVDYVLPQLLIAEHQIADSFRDISRGNPDEGSNRETISDLQRKVAELERKIDANALQKEREASVAHTLALTLAKNSERVYVDRSGDEALVFMIGNGSNLDRDVAAFKERNRLSRATGVFVDLSILYSEPTIPDSWIPVTDGTRGVEEPDRR